MTFLFLSLAARPSRKTKEAATLYMEMITKDLRSPDEDDESPLVGPRGKDMCLNEQFSLELAQSEINTFFSISFSTAV